MNSTMQRIGKFAVAAVIVLGQMSSCKTGPFNANTALKKELFKDIRQRIISDTEKGIVPSISISVAKNGKVIWQEAFGWANKDEKRAATPETIYSLASLSKSLTATGIMTLSENGKMDLNEPIGKYVSTSTIKSYAFDSNRITVKHLLNHTSGLPAHFNYFYADEAASPPSFEETLSRYGFTVSEPGSSFRYSNLGYGLLGFAISAVSRSPFSEFMNDEVFLPLGMTSTTFDVESLGGKDPAAKYDSQGNALDLQCDAPGSGSAYSTSTDLMKFALFLLGNEIEGSKSILSGEAIRRMVGEHSESSKYPYSSNTYYCQGFYLSQHEGYTEIWHEGGWDGASAMLKIIPEENIAVVALINTFNSEYVTRISNEIITTLMGPDKFEEQESTPTAGPRNRTIPENLTGTWKGEIRTYEGPITLTIDFTQAGDVTCATGDLVKSVKANWLRAYVIQSSVSGVFMSFRGKIPTEDTMRYPHEVFLSISKVGDKLIGEATAAMPFDPSMRSRMYAALSHYVELTKLEE